tara:strand:- start:1426 stop:4488 length:3063 start_codon:yes stop_codon:yes gene_type:complete
MMAIEDNIVDKIQPPDSQVDTADIIQAPDDMGLDMSEGTEVASRTSLIKNILGEQTKTLEKIKENPDASVRPIISKKPGEDSGLPDFKLQNDKIVFPEASQEFSDKVNSAVQERIEQGSIPGKPSYTKKDRENIEFQSNPFVTEEAFNTTGFDGDLPSYVNGVWDALEDSGVVNKKTVLTDNEVKEQAANLSLEPSLLKRIIDSDSSIGGDPILTRKTIDVLNESTVKLEILARKINDVQATDVDKLKFRQQITIHSLLLKGIKGIDTDRARAMAILRTRSDDVRAVKETLLQTNDVENITDLARAYVKFADNPAKRNKLIEKTAASSLIDIWVTTFINGLLYAPQTHLKNIIGNSLFGVHQVPERILAGFIGKLNPKDYEKIMPMEEFSMNFLSLKMTMQEATSKFKEGFVKNMATDPYTKIETGSDPSKINTLADDVRNFVSKFPFLKELDTKKDTLLGKAIDYYSMVTTGSGRFLLSQDEFFKGFFYRQELNRLILRRARKKYRDAIAKGVSENDAHEIMINYSREMYKNIPDDLDELAISNARRTTFTEPLPSQSLIPFTGDAASGFSLRTFEKFFGMQMFKPIIPFVRTPTNIALEVAERIPFIQAISPRFRDDFAAGGARRDLAISKFGLGMLYGTILVGFANEGRITGAGPKKSQGRTQWLNSGAKPYALVMSKDEWNNILDLSKDYNDPEFFASGKVSLSDDKVYISLSGFEPLSAFLAMAADYAEYARHEEDEDEIEKFAIGLSLGMYNYFSQLPMLQGLGDLSSAIGSSDINAETSATSGARESAKLFFDFFIKGSPLSLSNNSFMFNIERFADPTSKDSSAKNVIDEDTGKPLNLFVEAWYEALNDAKKRIPFYNDELPPRTNQWGDPIEYTQLPYGLELIFPTRVSMSQFSPADEFLFREDINLEPLTKQISGIKLDPVQYNQLKKIYGSITDESGESIRQKLYLQSLRPVFQGSNQRTKEAMVSEIHNDYRVLAVDKFLELNPDIRNRIQILDSKKEFLGRRAKEFD